MTEKHNAAVVVMKGISKHFGGVQALDNVDFEARAGEVHALMGENGAGKSTLIKVLSGAYTKDSGEVHVGSSAADDNQTRRLPEERCGDLSGIRTCARSDCRREHLYQ
ncbi:MAG: ATP-binding cassette domain-containing protein [Anaerolineales bacterium]|nr:ATP-binding cassette domain-containing protein [Anaerolineales bacterium]